MVAVSARSLRRLVAVVSVSPVTVTFSAGLTISKATWSADWMTNFKFVRSVEDMAERGVWLAKTTLDETVKAEEDEMQESTVPWKEYCPEGQAVQVVVVALAAYSLAAQKVAYFVTAVLDSRTGSVKVLLYAAKEVCSAQATLKLPAGLKNRSR